MFINPKVKRLQKLITYSSSIHNDDIKEKGIKMVSNGKKTKLDLYTRSNDDINKKTMQFENNKTNLAKLLKVDPVFEDLDTRLYNDFFKQSKYKSKSKSTLKKKHKKIKSKSNKIKRPRKKRNTTLKKIIK